MEFPEKSILQYDKAGLELGLDSTDVSRIMNAADGFLEYLYDDNKEIRRNLLSMIEKVYDNQDEDMDEIYIWPEQMWADFNHLHPISDSKEEEVSK